MSRNLIWIVCFMAGCGVAALPPIGSVDGQLAAETAQAVIRLRRKPDEPKPAPKPGECCGRCERGWITHGDGHKTPCPCPPTCRCKQ